MFLGVSASVCPVETNDLADRLNAVLNARPFMGNKRAAYRDAGVSPQTFDRALAGLSIRADKRAELEEFVALHEGGQADGMPDASDPEALVLATMADLRTLRQEVLGRIEELEREVGEDRGNATPNSRAGASPAPLSEERPNLQRVADEDPDLVAESEAQQEAP